MPKQVNIMGDMNGQVAVGSYINQFRDLNGCNINIIPPDKNIAWERREKPINIKSHPSKNFLNRTSEIQKLGKSIQSDSSMILSGSAGIGKTSLLHQLACLDYMGQFPDGIYCLSACELKLDDLLQCLFSVFYEGAISIKPNRMQIQIALQEIKALILMDDLTFNRDELQVVLDIAPNCVFIVASSMQVLHGQSESILLGGLPDKEALILFEQELGHSLIREEVDFALEICRLLKGHPENICWVAAKIREEKTSLDEIVAKLKTGSPDVLFNESVEALPQIEQQLLSILAIVEGKVVPKEHLDALLRSEVTNQASNDLTSRNLIQSHSPAYSLSESLSEMLARSRDLSGWEDEVIKYFVKWLSQGPADPLVKDVQDILLVLLNKAFKRKSWHEVLGLGRALDSVLIRCGYWQAWKDVLNLILEAAKALGDRKVEAWALHQLGSRSLCLGVNDQAEKLLKQAASIRRAIGDQAGLKLTQHNLSILVGAPPLGSIGKPAAIPQTLQYLMFGIGTITIVGLGVLASLMLFKPAAPELTQPQNNLIEESSQGPEFEWQSVIGGSTYQLQVDDQPDFSSPEYDATITSVTQAQNIILKQGSYYWRVRAISRFNKAGDWSGIWKFTISIPPAKAILTQPSDQYMETKPESLILSWENADNSSYYLVQIDNSEDFSSPEHEARVSNNSFSPPTALTLGLYYWRVRAFNVYDTAGEWSSTWQFTISVPPTIPSLSYPISDKIETSTTTPYFEWSHTENGITYQIQVDDNNDFSSPKYDKKLNETSVTSAISLEQGVYYWRVRAFNVYDTPGDWSKVWMFTISIPPDTPILTKPKDGFVDATTQAPVFEWRSVPNAQAYQIWLADNQDFSSILYENKTIDISHKIAKELPQGDCFWKVRAFNVYNTPGDWSKTWKITISIPPDAPILLEPTNGIKFESINKPAFKWKSVPNSVQYQIQVDNGNDFGSPEYDTTENNVNRTSTNIFAQGIYYWRVRAINKYGTPGKWSQTWQFTISNPPDTPALLEPFNNGFVYITRPTFRWNGVTNVAYYQLQVDNSSAFNSPEFTYAGADISYTDNTVLVQGVYYWRVRAVNRYETAGNWSQVWKFTVSIPPNAPHLLIPAYGNFVDVAKPTFQWQGVTNAANYLVQVDNNSSFSSPEYVGTSPNLTIKSSTTLPQGKYYWRVQAFNAFNTPGNWSEVWEFIVSIKPGTPTLYTPGYNTYIVDLQIPFSWSNATNASSYQIQIDNDSDFSSPELDNSITSVTLSIYRNVLIPKGLKCENTYLFPYHWRVRAINQYGAPGFWSSEWVFTLKYWSGPC